MAESEPPTSRARLRRWLGALAAAVLVAAAVAAGFLPTLLPSTLVRREVAAMLSERLGRPVTVATARLDWREGLTATGVRIRRRDGEGPLACADRLRAGFGPIEAARAAAGRGARIESLRFDGLELWLVLDEQGRLNVADLLEGEPMDVGMVQMGGARVHFLNRRTGGRLDFENVHATVGTLTGTGNGYVSLSADLCRESRDEADAAVEAAADREATDASTAPSVCGHVVVTANLDRLAVGPDGMPVGSMKAEWSHLPWDRLWAVVAPESPLAGTLRQTSGRMSATVRRGTWSAEGAVRAGQLAWPAEGDASPTALLPTAILGFRLHRSSASVPVVLDMVTVSAPGLDLKATGTVAPDRRPRGGKAGASPERPWARPRLDLEAEGAVSWGPLCHSAGPLGPLLDTFDRLGGKAQFGLEVETDDEGYRLAASADFTDTLMVAEGRFEKDERDGLRLRLWGRCDRRFRSLSEGRLAADTDAARLRLKGSAPLAGLLEAVTETGPDGVALPARLARLAGAEATARAEVRDSEALLALVPALGQGLGPLKARGSCRFDLAVRPIASDEGASAGAGTGKEAAAGRPAGAGAARRDAPGDDAEPQGWTAALHADLTDAALDLDVPGGSTKPVGTLCRLDADAVFWPAKRRSDLRRVGVRLGDASMAWDGSARIDWPRKKDEQPVGRFQGTLALEGLAKAGAMLVPGRFAAAPPVAGGAVFDVTADLTEGRLRTRMEAGLGRMGLRLGRYLVKPAGRPASLALTTLWHLGRWNRVEAEADLDLPAVRLSALGQAVLVAEWQRRPPPPEGSPASSAGRPSQAAALSAAASGASGDAPRGTLSISARRASRPVAGPVKPRPGSSLAVTLGPKSTVEIQAHVSDAERAASLSPLLAEALKERRAEGRAEGRFVLSLRQHGLQAAGELDLTETALDLGRLLKKPAGRVLRGRVAGDIAPHPGGWVDVHLATAEARLAESVTRLDGRVRLDWTGLAAPVDPSARLTASIDEADLAIEGNWQHGPALNETLPWLAPLRKRCGLEGATRWRLALSGTPTRGRVDLTLDATGCRVSAAAGRGDREEPVTVKEAGTPASVRLKVRYGEVPGEVEMEQMEVRLAEATASARGRMLFADPRLLTLEVPDAWTLRLEAQVPDAAILASLLPWHLADLEPTGAVGVQLRVAADARGAEVESCRLRFDAARIRWLGRSVLLDGPVAYDHERLETEGLNLKVGGSDVRLVTYIARPKEDPTGSLIVRGTALDLAEVREMIRRTSESLAPRSPEAGEAPAANGGGDAFPLARRLRRLLARAHLSADVRLDRVTLVNPAWDTRYDLAGLEAEGRLAEGRFLMPRFRCRLNRGTVRGRMRLDFGQDPPVLHVAYDARDLAMDENLEPYIDTTFPGMKVFGTLSTRATRTQPLAEDAHPVGRGETVLTDGVLAGPAAPDYIANLLPGLKLTRYHFNRMSNVFENRPDGTTDNRMLFDGKAYDLFIFGVSHPDGRTRYTLGVDLLLSLGSDTLSRTLGQGKLPLMHYNGRIVGKQFAERDVSYVLPHEFAYEVFLKRNLLLKLIHRLGRPEPDIKKPRVVPKEEHRIEPRRAEPRP